MLSKAVKKRLYLEDPALVGLSPASIEQYIQGWQKWYACYCFKEVGISQQ